MEGGNLLHCFWEYSVTQPLYRFDSLFQNGEIGLPCGPRAYVPLVRDLLERQLQSYSYHDTVCSGQVENQPRHLHEWNIFSAIKGGWRANLSSDVDEATGNCVVWNY